MSSSSARARSARMRASVKVDTGRDPLTDAVLTPLVWVVSATVNQRPSARTITEAAASATFQVRWKRWLSQRCATTRTTRSARKARAARTVEERGDPLRLIVGQAAPSVP